MADTTARLRKAFRYQNDEDMSDNSRDEMDEEEQEKLLNTLQTREDNTNTFITTSLTILPLILIIPFLYYIFTTRHPIPLLCLLSITSLLATSWTMAFIPLWLSLPSSRSGVVRRSENPPIGWRPNLPELLDLESDGPLYQTLPYLNAAICGVLLLAAYGLRGKKGTEDDALWMILLVPAVMWMMVFVARRGMAEVGKELYELKGMRYGLKGA